MFSQIWKSSKEELLAWRGNHLNFKLNQKSEGKNRRDKQEQKEKKIKSAKTGIKISSTRVHYQW